MIPHKRGIEYGMIRDWKQGGLWPETRRQEEKDERDRGGEDRQRNESYKSSDLRAPERLNTTESRRK